jgi:uncharacterized membrane protein
MNGFLPLAVTLVIFLASHTVISRPFLRDPLRNALGRRGYGMLHGIISLVGMVAVFWGFWQAPYIGLWPPYPELQAIPAIVMPVACILAAAGMITPGAGLQGDSLPEGDNPAPGILSITRHPLPWALILWALAHLVANGDVAGAVLFGIFLVFSALAPPLVDRRRRRCGEEAWQRFAAASPTIPFAGPGPIDWKGIGWKPVLLGLAIYASLLLLHPVAIGIDAVYF